MIKYQVPRIAGVSLSVAFKERTCESLKEFLHSRKTGNVWRLM